MSSIAQWDEKLKCFINIGSEPLEVPGRVLLPINPDSEPTLKLEIGQPPKPRMRGSAAIPRVSGWRLFCRWLADWLERLSVWVRP